MATGITFNRTRALASQREQHGQAGRARTGRRQEATRLQTGAAGGRATGSRSGRGSEFGAF